MLLWQMVWTSLSLVGHHSINNFSNKILHPFLFFYFFFVVVRFSLASQFKHMTCEELWGTYNWDRNTKSVVQKKRRKIRKAKSDQSNVKQATKGNSINCCHQYRLKVKAQIIIPFVLLQIPIFRKQIEIPARFVSVCVYVCVCFFYFNSLQTIKIVQKTKESFFRELLFLENKKK